MRPRAAGPHRPRCAAFLPARGCRRRSCAAGDVAGRGIVACRPRTTRAAVSLLAALGARIGGLAMAGDAGLARRRAADLDQRLAQQRARDVARYAALARMSSSGVKSSRERGDRRLQSAASRRSAPTSAASAAARALRRRRHAAEGDARAAIVRAVEREAERAHHGRRCPGRSAWRSCSSGTARPARASARARRARIRRAARSCLP